jgi:alpha-tubulin suppressor-like RCC1 family protein
MAITDKEQGVWSLDQVYNKINEGGIWGYTGDDQLWSWGYGGDGQLGQNSRTSQSSPMQIGGSGWAYISSSISPDTLHQTAVKTDGTLWSWGRNNNGGLGQNNQSPSGISSPAQVGIDTDWGQQIVRGYMSSYGIKTDGTLWSWGYNQNYGALGHNNKTALSSPTQVPGTWNKIATRHFGVIASKADGSLWGWGRNTAGEIGDNSTGSSSSPKQIPGTTWTGTVSGGYFNSCAIKTDGTLWTWGYNEQGELGHNNDTSYSSPKQLGTGTDWSTVGSGRQFTLAIKTNGTLWGWGTNENGELSQNNEVHYSSPTQIPGTDWSNIISGNYHSLAVKTDGTLWAMGGNNQGQLGQNAVNNNGLSSPVQVPGTDWNSADNSFGAGRNISFATKSL